MVPLWRVVELISKKEKEVKMKRNIKKPLALLVIFVMLFTMIPSSVFATSDGVDKEWYNFRNNQFNNGVTERKTPIDKSETWMRFAVKYGEGWSAAPTPPLILDNHLYIAVGKQVLKLDKETGEKVAESDTMKGGVGFAMNPILYADGKLFVQVGNGVIQALDYETLECLWHTETIPGQTISPLSYVNIDGKGYIYTGTWRSEIADGTFFCFTTDDENLTKEVNSKGEETGRMVKKDLWKFVPKKDDEKLANDTQAKPRGFYWAGAYACENYIAIGSDDGAREPSPDQIDLPEYNKGVFYTLDPLTGEIIDRIDGIQGDIRSTVVFDNGYLYFNTKGGLLFKVKVNEDGTFDHSDIQKINLGGMTTATPIVYKDKIYIGVAGKGGQFDPDAGHRFAVISNVGDLEEIYSLPIPGYPQAGALLSTAHEDEDYNHDGKPDGRVYIYFTYNAPPGGIYYTYDTPDGEDIPEGAGEIFIPPDDMQQYCISTIIADREGTLYYKNDSCNIFAVEINSAFIENLEVSVNGNKGAMTPSFDSRTASYEVVVEDTESIELNLTLPDGVTAEVDGVPYTPGMKINTPEEKTEIKIVTTKEKQHRTYTVNVRKLSENALLKELNVSTSNSVGASLIPVTPELSPDVFEYVSDVTDIADRSFYNVWPKVADPKAKMEVIPVSNAGRIDEIKSGPAHRFAVYPDDTSKSAVVNIKVTSETGNTVNNYRLELRKKIDVTGVQITDGNTVITDKDNLTMNVGDKKSFTAKVLPEDASVKDVTWSVFPENLAELNAETGELIAKAPGEITLGVTTKDKAKTETVKINIIQPVTGVEITTNETSLTQGDKITFTAKVMPEDASIKDVTWQVDNEDIAEIDETTGVLTAKGEGKVSVTVTTKDGNKKATKEITVKKPVIAVTGVEITDKPETISAGDTFDFKASVLPEEATDKNVNWSVDNKDVAEIDELSGRFTAKTEGTVKVTVTTKDGNYKDVVEVKIGPKTVPVEKIEIKGGDRTLTTGDKVQLEAVIIPDFATHKEVKWSSDNPGIADVNALTGEIMAIAEGKAVIRAETKDGLISAEINVTVKASEVKINEIRITPPEDEVKVGDVVSLKATVLPENAINKELIWSVDNTDRAAIDSVTGELKALKAGKIKVTATDKDGTVKDEYELEILTDKVLTESVKIKGGDRILKVNDKVTLEAIVLPENATTKDVRWSVDNSSIASIDEITGQLSAIKEGTVNVTVTTLDNGNKDTISVVVEKQDSGYEPVPGPDSGEGEIVKPETGENGSLEIKADNTKATVSASDILDTDNNIVINFNNGITVEYDKAAADIIRKESANAVKVEFSIEKTTDGMNEKQKKTLEKENGKAVFSINIKAVNADGTVKVHDFGSGKAKVTVPYTLTKGMSAQVYRVENDGSLTRMESSYEDGMLSWITNGHSYYMVKEVAASETGNSKAESPKTGDKADMIPWVILLIGAAGVAAVLRRKEEK